MVGSMAFDFVLVAGGQEASSGWQRLRLGCRFAPNGRLQFGAERSGAWQSRCYTMYLPYILMGPHILRKFPSRA